MRKALLLLGVILLLGIIMIRQLYPTPEWLPLDNAPDQIEKVNEIALIYNRRLPKFYNALTPQERVFIYYLFRAALPGMFITTDQLHHDAHEIRLMFEDVLAQKKRISTHDQLNHINRDEFISNVRTYLTYFWTNHSQYFRQEPAEQKRTPARLGLSSLTPENLVTVLTALGYQDAQEKIERLAPSLFDCAVEPTLTVPGSIDQSAVNFYAPNFTDADFDTLEATLQTPVNAYFSVGQKDNKRIAQVQRYKIGGKCDKELSVSLYWLEKAYEQAKHHPKQFDEHFVSSLSYLCDFIRTGDENLFKKHSIAWLKSTSHIDYCFGFIETYFDPKSYRGEFQAEVTIKSIDINALNFILPALERQLPFPDKYKRTNLDDLTAIPNASINTKVFAMGGLGPANLVLAYALPNYAEIRAEHGSKQIIYHPEKGLGESINPSLYQQLFYSDKQYEWSKIHDPDGDLRRAISTLHVILHETLGHGSGRIDTHVFQESESLTIEGVTYHVGDTIPVTSSNIQQLLAGYDQTIEELRAETIALYSFLSNYDGLAASGLLGNWPEKIEKEKMLKLGILDMGYFGLHRLLRQPDNATAIAGDHARANMTILHWLIDHDAIEIVQEHKTIDNKDYTVLGIQVTDLQNAIDAITELAQHVQRIKSTGDGLGAKTLLETYGIPVRNPEYIAILKRNHQAVVGDLKISASLFSHFKPILNGNGEITDINASWPKDIVEQYQWFNDIALSTN